MSKDDLPKGDFRCRWIHNGTVASHFWNDYQGCITGRDENDEYHTSCLQSGSEIQTNLSFNIFYPFFTDDSFGINCNNNHESLSLMTVNIKIRSMYLQLRTSVYLRSTYCDIGSRKLIRKQKKCCFQTGLTLVLLTSYISCSHTVKCRALPPANLENDWIPPHF